jgi:uncharacterized protein YraI
MLVVLSAASAAAEPATVISTVNLRSGAGTTNEIVGKIPSGSLVETANCGEWCEVEWQGKKGFAIATSLDRTGRVPARRTVKRSDPFATDVAAPHKSVLDTPRSGQRPLQGNIGAGLSRALVTVSRRPTRRIVMESSCATSSRPSPASPARS